MNIRLEDEKERNQNKKLKIMYITIILVCVILAVIAITIQIVKNLTKKETKVDTSDLQKTQLDFDNLFTNNIIYDKIKLANKKIGGSTYEHLCIRCFEQYD